MSFFEQHGALGLFLMAVAESSFFPIPPDSLLILLALKWPHQALMLAGLTTLGSVIGGLIGYAIGHWGGRPLLQRFASPEKIARVEGLFERYGVWGVFVAGFTPIPYKVFTIASGVCGLRIMPFALASFFSRGLRFFLVAILLQHFGEHIKQHLDLIGLILVGVCVLGVVVWILIRRRKGTAPQEDTSPDAAE